MRSCSDHDSGFGIPLSLANPESLVPWSSRFRRAARPSDVLDAMSVAQQRGARLAAIVNTPMSTLDRTVETRVLLRAGVEQCVLATKSYTTMLATLLLAAHAVDGRWATGADLVLRAADAIESMLESGSRERIKEVATRLAAARTSVRDRPRRALPICTGGRAEDQRGQLHPCRGFRRRRVEARRHRPRRSRHAVRRLGAARRHAGRTCSPVRPS